MAASGLARELVAGGLITADAVEAAAAEAARQGRPLASHLVAKGLVEAQALAEAASQAFGLPITDLADYPLERLPTGLVTERLIQANHALPLYERDGRLYVAISDPTHRGALDEFKFHTGLATEEVLVAEDQLASRIAAYLESRDHAGLLPAGDEDLSLELEAVDDSAQRQPELDETSAADDTPVVRFINKMLLDAIRGGASDLHFEPFENAYRVRFRTDGVLHEVARPPVSLGPRIAARLKVMSRMNISERRLPQDGRIKLKISRSRSVDLRINTLPVLAGEKLCLRILDPEQARLGIDALGYEEDQKALFLEALRRPQGLILVTGPTGSGKTVSLYTGLDLLNTPERNIATAEDPVEINLPGINQCPVNHKAGLDFSEALRAFLRQDPDVIMVGEIRDLETASMAIKAAQTGHLVMSTLHTNSAAETLTRLRSMGVAAYNLATSVSLIVSQRLARRLCDCKQPLELPPSALLEKGFTEAELAEGARLYAAKGCGRCRDGYSGRVGIFEVMKITPAIAGIILEGGNALQLAEASRQAGFRDLHAAARLKARQGLTSLDEIDRVVSTR